MLKIIKFGERFSNPVVLCLGHYESLHIGHSKIINNAKRLAKANHSSENVSQKIVDIICG